MELYARVRRAIFVEGVSEREAAQRFGLARETVRKMLRYAAAPGYRRQKRTSQREMFVPLTHPPGHAQADFGEAQVEIGGVLAKAHYFVIDLPHSDESYVRAFPAETTEAFLRGARQGVSLLGWRAATDSLRQHNAGGGADPRRRDAAEDAGVLGAAVALLVRGAFWEAGQGKRPGEGREPGEGRPTEFLRTAAPVPKFGKR